MNIIKGIANGVILVAGTLVSMTVNVAKNALDWVKDKLGIYSPPRMFRNEVGVMIGRDTVEGIDRSREVASRSLGELADGLMLDGYTLGMPTPMMSLLANVCQMVNGMQSNQQDV